MSSSAHAPQAPGGDIDHARRFGALWLGATVVATPLVIIFVGPLLAPSGTDQASGQRFDMTVLAAVATPVILLIVLFLLYTIVYFRQPPGGVLEGPAVRDDARVQTTWILTTGITILALAAFGTYELEVPNGAGAGAGPTPLTTPSGAKLPVQVIGQQWLFTYRYPTYGGVETTELVLPVDKQIEFNVTSLDVIHSFWAHGLGVKADANPDVNNVVFVKPETIQHFRVHCAELCGLWHGAMQGNGRVVSATAFQSWIAEQQRTLAPATRLLPKYSKTYLPEPIRRGG